MSRPPVPEFSPGRLDPAWLREQDDLSDPWVLLTADPEAPGHRDAFIGNGFLGQRLDVGGEASGLLTGDRSVPGGCMVHGLWGELALMPAPRWAVLTFNDGTADLAAGVGQWKNYCQKLDLRTATLETNFVWKHGPRETRITTVGYVSRSRPQVCFLSRTIIPNYDGTVHFTDSLNGASIDDARDWRFTNGNTSQAPLSLQLRMGPRDRQVALVSLLRLDGVGSTTVTELPAERGVGRTISFEAKAGRTYTVTKIVALVTDHESPGPWVHARALAEAAAADLPLLRKEHETAWATLWKHRIETSHRGLQKLLNASLYQFYCHLRAGGKSALGPTGLSANFWGGHVFWDSDLWMFPGLCLLQPDLARGLVEYRVRTLDGARRNARAHGLEGAQFAWESAEFGDETIPHLVYHHQHHVTSDVALAQWWYWKISGDDAFFRGHGSEVVIEAARFWASRVWYNQQEDRYEIHGVCCADEFAEIQDNNAYTNYSAVKTLELAALATEFLGKEVPPRWREIIAKMWIPFDPVNARYLEYADYAGQTIKQADAALLIYPYEMPMADEVRANTVDYYRTKYPPANIMMAAAFDGIVDCQLGRAEAGWTSLEKLLPHFREPYLLASESPANECVSFATGLGGFLQLVIIGFGGLRVHDQGLTIAPAMPSDLRWMKIFGLHYDGVSFDLRMENGQVEVTNPSTPILFKISKKDGTAW